MGGQLLASKIITTEAKPRIRSIPTLPTAVIGVQGVAERGPINTPTLCQSWEDYVRIFGGFTTDGDLAQTVWGIYLNHRSARVWVNRLVHYTSLTPTPVKESDQASVDIPGTTATAVGAAVTSGNAGPWNLNPGQTLQIKEDGGGPVAATFTATQATRAGSGLSITDINGETLILKIDDGETQTITFTATHAGDPDGAAAEINEQLVGGYAVVDTGEIDLFSDTYGSDSKVEITGGTALTELGHSVGSSTPTGDPVANINSVTYAETKAIVEAVLATVTVTEETDSKITITTNTPGASKSIQIDATSTATAFGFDNNVHNGSDTSSSTVIKFYGKYDGTYAHDTRIVVEDATNGETDYFNVKVTDADGVLLEPVFSNMQNSDDTGLDFVDTVFNASVGGSLFLTAEDQDVGDRPDNGTYTPTGGDDGLNSPTGLTDTDWLGTVASQTGIHAFDSIRSDLTDFLDGGRATSGWHNGLLTYCEVDASGKIHAKLDPPEGLSYTEIVTYVKTTAALKGLSEHGSIYWPRPQIIPPDTETFGTDNLVVPASGIVGGVVSRQDNARPGGVYYTPAGVEDGRMFGVVGFEDDNVLREEVRDYIYPENINPLTVLTGFPRFIDGVMNLKSDGSFPTIAERRGLNNIKRSIEAGLQVYRHRDNDAALRAEVQRTVYNFMVAQMRLGAFASRDPNTAFFVDFSEALNPPSVIAAFQLRGRVGVAMKRPAEYIWIEFVQDTRALEEELAG